MFRLARLITLAGLVLAFVPTIAWAGCAQDVINDYQADGRIDGSYSSACLQSALKAVPPDAAQYTDIVQVIEAAMGGGGSGSGGGTPPTTTGPKPKPKPKPKPATTAESVPSSTTGLATPPPTTDSGSGPLQEALDGLGPKRADEVPTPVIVLGILAVVLVAVGAGGLVWQRRRRGSEPDPGAAGATIAKQPT